MAGTFRPMSNNRDEQILKAFGENLKRLREAKGLSTRAFADKAEIAYSQVWTLETGQGDPSLTTLLSIARALDVSVDVLVP
jgi:transcriptional regulator with XRE-family HTH domain